MTLREFREMTAHGTGDEELVIEVFIDRAVGRTPSVPVRSAIVGFDWDSGRVVITPEQVLETRP